MSCFTCDEFVGLVAFRVATFKLGTTGLWISRSELAPLDLVEKLDQREAQKTCFFFLDRKTRGLGLKITRVRIRVRVEIKGG